MHRPAGVPAIVYRVPGLGAGIGAFARPGRTGVAVLYHARRVARITRGRRGEAWASRAFNGGVAALTADRRRRGVLDRDGLMNLSAGITAIVYRMPCLGPGIGAFARPGC